MAEALNKKNLRIAIIDPVGKKAGMDHYDISLAGALKDQSCIVDVYSNFTDAGGLAKKQFDFTFSKNIFRFCKLIYDYLSALIISKWKKTEIIITHVFHSSIIDFIFIRLTGIFGFKICIIVHDVESFVSENSKSWIKNILNVSDYVIVHNQVSYLEIIKKKGGRNSEKINIIPHGNFLTLPVKIDRGAALKRFNLGDNHRFILFFGMIKKAKGLEILIQAMKDVKEDIHLIIAGRTRDVSFSNYQAVIDNLGLGDRIHSSIRYITNDERNILFNLTDLVILPYHKIYQSGVMLMAMSYGVPVICSDLPANRLNQYDDDTFFKPGDSADLAKKINSLMNDEERRKSISKSLVDFVGMQHNWRKIADSYINVLN